MFDGIRARMFNRVASHRISQPDRGVASLGLRNGDVVADLGSGGGFFALRFARDVGPDGKVYAIDVNPAFLGFVDRQAISARLANLKTVPVPKMEEMIPGRSLDFIFCRGVYHHLLERTGYFGKMARHLKPGGRVAIIDYLPSAGRFFGPPAGHRTEPGTIISEMDAAGYSLVQRLDFLERQAFIIFRHP